MGQGLSTLVFQVVILAALLLMAVLPFAAILLFVERLRTRQGTARLTVAGLLLLGFVLGGAIGWANRPDAWTMPLWRTFEASVDSDKYGHPVESQAERVVLYFLFGGVLGTAMAALAAPVVLRYWPTGRPPSGSSASVSGTCT